ncbi:SdiA-regulated [Aquimarina amphilecti]|uniref:SdiA-regulated n=1 Tax=Aquimarina amphilecti TaxID=1038014 RepID=A0A1H7WWD7_AQUAM|nr:SdiA-regulated domain-containing protein [Aquimarina amphilecti]SEM25615.1 SdiA-regulated [Aquimarina amphilecti]
MKLKIFTLLVCITLSVSCQKKSHQDFLKVNQLSNSLKEISGITGFPNEPHLYAINDSGNDNVLFRLDKKGKILNKIKIPNSKNVDWEDLAYDHQNNLYIGDFGNNNNDRKKLKIYKISGISSNTPETSVIEFTLEDQKKFPPSKKKRNFDIEAFIYKNGSFYLFTKNRSTKFNGKTKLYKLPNAVGEIQIAKLIDSYKICDDSNDCFVSGAAINPKGNKIALLTYNKIFILSDFDGDNLFNGEIKKIKLNHFSQKEGICFKNDSTLIIVDEKRKNSKGKIYEYRLNE